MLLWSLKIILVLATNATEEPNNESAAKVTPKGTRCHRANPISKMYQKDIKKCPKLWSNYHRIWKNYR